MHQTIERLRWEYLEMPGLKLSAEQVQRLCGVERRICTAVLDALVREKFLWLRKDGTYARLTEGPVGRLRVATATMGVDDPLRKASA